VKATFKCLKCGYEEELEEGKTIRYCPACGHDANLVPVQVEFKREGNWIRVIQKKEFYKTKEQVLEELRNAINVEKRKIEDAEQRIKILEDRIRRVEKL